MLGLVTWSFLWKRCCFKILSPHFPHHSCSCPLVFFGFFWFPKHFLPFPSNSPHVLRISPHFLPCPLNFPSFSFMSFCFFSQFLPIPSISLHFLPAPLQILFILFVSFGFLLFPFNACQVPSVLSQFLPFPFIPLAKQIKLGRWLQGPEQEDHSIVLGGGPTLSFYSATPFRGSFRLFPFPIISFHFPSFPFHVMWFPPRSLTSAADFPFSSVQLISFPASFHRSPVHVLWFSLVSSHFLSFPEHFRPASTLANSVRLLRFSPISRRCLPGSFNSFPWPGRWSRATGCKVQGRRTIP